MAIELRKAENGQEVILGPFLDDTDGKTAETTLTIANTDIKIWKAGATSLVNKNSGGATHIANGYYYIVLDATDTGTAGSMVITCSMAGALPVQRECYVRESLDYMEFNYWRNCVFFSAAAGGTTTTIPIDSVLYSDISARTMDGAYVGMQLWSVLNDLSVRRVTGYVGATKTLTVDPPLASAPSAGLYFMLVPGAPGVLADNAITAAKVATNAIDADALATDAVTEMQSGLATSAALATVNAYVDELESRLTATRAGYLDNLSGGAVATAANLSTVAGYVDTEVAAIKAKTDLIPASPAAVGSAMTLADGAITEAKVSSGGLNAIADALLKRDFSAVTGEAARSMLNALRFLRNRFAVSGTTLTVYKENDSTAAWTGTVTTSASADPITGNDPA